VKEGGGPKRCPRYGVEDFELVYLSGRFLDEFSLIRIFVQRNAQKL